LRAVDDTTEAAQKKVESSMGSCGSQAGTTVRDVQNAIVLINPSRQERTPASPEHITSALGMNSDFKPGTNPENPRVSRRCYLC